MARGHAAVWISSLPLCSTAHSSGECQSGSDPAMSLILFGPFAADDPGKVKEVKKVTA